HGRTTLEAGMPGTTEPRTAPPAARQRALGHLGAAGVPIRVMVAPIVPGLTDTETPAILKAAAAAGARAAGYVLLRLPLAVNPVFLDWLRRTQPTKADRVESLIRSTRAGGLNDATFGRRMRGTGAIADQIQQTFKVFIRKLGLDRKGTPLDTTQFQPPRSSSGQLRLF